MADVTMLNMKQPSFQLHLSTFWSFPHKENASIVQVGLRTLSNQRSTVILIRQTAFSRLKGLNANAFLSAAVEAQGTFVLHYT